MNAPQQPPRDSLKLPPRSTGEKPDAAQVVEYVTQRFPKTMARLAE